MQKLISLTFVTLISIGFFMFSCRKTDKSFTSISDKLVVVKFLQLPSTASPQLKRIAQKLEALHQKHGFLNDIARADGYPVWDKTITYTTKPSGIKNRAHYRQTNATDTIIYIPLVLGNANRVNAFIYARLNDSLSLSLHSVSNYSNLPFGILADSSINAEKFALQFMILDYSVFGHSGFKITDNRLFKEENTLLRDSVSFIKKVTITPVHTHLQQGRGSGIIAEEFEICIDVLYFDCPVNGACCIRANVPIGTCENCKKCWRPGKVCKRASTFVANDDGWYPGGGGSQGNGDMGGGIPGGTNNNNNSNTQPPCSSTPSLENGIRPCSVGLSSGFEPMDDEIAINPCSQIQQTINDSTKKAFMTKVKELSTPQNLNLDYEKGVTLSGKSPTQATLKEDIGASNTGYVSLPNLPDKQKYFNIMHNHPNIIGGSYSVFSFQDLARVAKLLESNQLELKSFTAFLSTYKGTNYAYTITHPQKLIDFFYSEDRDFSDPEIDKIKYATSLQKAVLLQSKFYLGTEYAAPLIKETETDNERVLGYFLDFMSEADIGITLLETNANFNTFSKVEKNSNGVIVRVPCN
jgi:hypothetical protein